MSKRVIVVLSVCAAATAVGIGAAAIPSKGRISGCYDAKTGVLRVVDLEAGIPGCTAREKPLSWSEAGPKGDPGAPGTFPGIFRSPNGRFSISVTNDGLRLAGRGGSIEVTDNGLTVDSPDQLVLRADDGLTVASSKGNIVITGGAAVEITGLAGVRIKSPRDVTIKGSKIGNN